MTDRRHTEEERVQRLLAAAAELPGGPALPGADFTARARRGLARRRLGAAAGAAVVVLATAVGAPALLKDSSGRGEPYAAASAPCLRSTVRDLGDGRQAGFQVVYGELRAGAVPMDDGVTEGSAFRFDIDGTLTDSGGGPSSGPALVWYPVSQTQLPRPGRYVLPLAQAERPAKDGRRLFEFRPDDVLPLDTEGRVRLTCAEGTTGSVELDRLRAALTDRIPLR
ncbi:hypothetical protein [Streptomyces sp. NPDC002057]|uniref:hypothetical protein n=1 Tax=Streptomyces sp. NPDC002057 TaxID=3154664 RepID=UPI00331AB33F